MKSAAYRNYLLVCLVILYAFNFMDIAAFGMALQSIKASLHLTDTELGLVSGLAFSLFYSTVGVLLGRWADVGNRVTVISITRCIWGALVLLTGRVHSFAQMFAVRMGVAIGESGFLPPAYSFVGDYFSREERPRALGTLWLGIPLATVLGFFGSGWLIQHYGWRDMFTIIGMPSFALGLIAWLTLKEPRVSPRENYTDQAVPGLRSGVAPPPPVPYTFKRLFANATYRNVVIAFVVGYFINVSLGQWQAAFFIRSYHLKTDTLGAWLALVFGVPGVIGNYLGGVIASRRIGSNERAQLSMFAILQCCTSIIMPFVYLTRNEYVAFALIGLSVLVSNLGNAPVTGCLQAVVPSRMRAVSIMILYLFANLIGMGIAPVMTGVLSDALRPHFGVDSLRYALIWMSPWFFISGWFAWRARSTVMQDVRDALKGDQTHRQPALLMSATGGNDCTG